MMKKLVSLFDSLNEQVYKFKKSLPKLVKVQIKEVAYIKELFANKSGLEIGGPSGLFRNDGFVPIYSVLKALDGCNFSNTTMWEGSIKSGAKYNYFRKKDGVQYISEATDLSFVSDSKYEFVISCNCLEHVANPLKAVEEWLRVITADGLLLLALPNKEYNFDCNRPVTQFSHLLDDYRNNTTEHDLTHLDEILALHDLRKDKSAGSLEKFKARSLDNFNNRGLHQHIFDTELLKEMFNYFNLDVLFTSEGKDFIIIGKKRIAK